MSPIRIAVFFIETALSFAAGLAVSQRAGAGRAASYVITTLVWAATIVVPAHALAMLHVLSFRTLAACAVGVSVSVLLLTQPKEPDLLARAWSLVTAPAAVSAATCASTLWPSVDTLA